MRAVRYQGIGQVGIEEIPDPEPRPGHAIVRVRAVGVCQTDVHFRANPELALEPGRVLGHEIAGTIESLPEQSGGLNVGDSVLVYPIWSCGTCRQCVAGRENACLSTPARLTPSPTVGVTRDGGLAERVSVPLSALVATPGLRPEQAAPLADAGLVPYHCLSGCRDLLRPGTSALVIGLGGLGQFAAALLRATTAVEVIGVDVRQAAIDGIGDKLDHAFLATDPDVAEKILAAAGGHGPTVVLDFVGNSATLKLAGAVVAPYGAIRVPGQSDGEFVFETIRTTTALPRGATIDRPFAGTKRDLVELVDLATRHDLGTQTVRYSFDQALQAFDDLAAGRVTGRAVVTFD